MAEAGRVRAGDFHKRLYEDGYADEFLGGPHVGEAVERIAARLALARGRR